MTTRNFRVNNGLSVGDITISASANTITGLATGAPSADGDVSNKKYVDDSIAAISTTAITQGNSNVTVTDSGTGAITVSADATEVANLAVAATTITAVGNINLTAGADVVVPANVGVTFGSGEKIEGDNTDLTVTSGAKINLTAGSDVHIPNNVGIAFGTGGEKIESDGTDLTVTSTGALNLTVTGLTTVSGALAVSGDLTVNGTTTTNNSVNLTVDDNIIELNSGISTSNNDAGIIIERGSTGNNAAILWDESADKFTMGLTTATAGDKSGGISLSGVSTLVANLEGAVTGNADTATTLESARNIGGVSFDGSGNINLPGVNTAGNQDTSGTAAIGTAVTVTANNSTNETVYLTFVDGATGTQGIETDTGLSYNPSTNVLSTTASSAQYADVAERFEADAPMEIGSVVEVGGSAEITEATSEMSQDVFGVISHKPGYMMNAGAGSDETHPYVAMTGRTPVRVTGVVNKGQRLVTSSIKGCARAVAAGESISPFNVIGRALETSTDANIKLVNCAVRTNN